MDADLINHGNPKRLANTGVGFFTLCVSYYYNLQRRKEPPIDKHR